MFSKDRGASKNEPVALIWVFLENPTGAFYLPQWIHLPGTGRQPKQPPFTNQEDNLWFPTIVVAGIYTLDLCMVKNCQQKIWFAICANLETRMKIVFFLEDKHSQACTSLSLIIIVKQSRLCLSKSGFLAGFRREYKRGYHLQNPKPMRVAVNA